MKTKAAVLHGVGEDWKIEDVDLGDRVAGEVAPFPIVGGLDGASIVTKVGPEDLETLWRAKPKFPRPMMMSSSGLHTIWAYDRLCDAVNGSRSSARQGMSDYAAAR